MNEDLIYGTEATLFSINEHEYSAGKLDAKRQFHIVRRLAPFMESFVQDGNISSRKTGFSGGVSETGFAGGEETGFAGVEKAAAAFLKIAGTVPDEQLDYVIDNCVSVVKRKDGDIWAAISAPLPNGGRVLQYKDIDMAAMLLIVFNVLKRNLSGFFDALPSDLTEKIKGMASVT